ncbi:MAG: DUF624 domain-containing protein [Lachnospiraceae bacterium]|nr:DUF624 domain-containing protein [Lachnospiraceae bacterium]
MSGITQMFDSDSSFGKLLTRAGIWIGANLLFLFCSIPIFTVGASLCAMYYVMLRYLRCHGEINPWKEFWKEFRKNFVSATIVWLSLLAVAGLLMLEIFWCSQFSGVMHVFRYALHFLLAAEAVISVYIFPCMAAFDAPVKCQFANSLFFAGKSPLTIFGVTAAVFLPFYFTYTLIQWLPLTAFLWCFFGFSMVAWLQSRMFLRLFLPYLPTVNAYGERMDAAGAAFAGSEEPAAAGMDRNDRREDNRRAAAILDEMKRMGM